MALRLFGLLLFVPLLSFRDYNRNDGYPRLVLRSTYKNRVFGSFWIYPEYSGLSQWDSFGIIDNAQYANYLISNDEKIEITTSKRNINGMMFIYSIPYPFGKFSS